MGAQGDIIIGLQHPSHWHEFILDRMQDPELGLCFRLSDAQEECCLVPEALPKAGPDYVGIWPADSLRFRYQYDLLPPGLIPRFIVQAHRNLTPEPTRWRTGVVLAAARCKALVRGDREKRRIDIEVTGPAGSRRGALNVVLNDLEYVHDLNPEIGADPRVPLPDQPGISVSYEHLLRMEELKGPGYELHPEGAARDYTVQELLAGVRRDRPSHGEKEPTTVTKIEIKIGDNVTFNGDFAVGKKIQDSFNKSQASSSSEEVKGLLGQLAEEVAKVAEQLPEDDATDLADDLESFTKEAVKPQPKPSRWESVATRIGEAAQTAGQVGKTAMTLLEKLGPLLGS